MGIWFLADGLVRLLVCAAILFGIDFAIDRLFHMDRAQRGIMLAIMAIVLAVVLFRRLIRPLTTRLTNRAICHEVEKTHPELADRLTTAIELSRHEPTRDISKALTDAAIEDGFSVSRDLAFNDLIRRGRFATNVFLVCLIVAGVSVAALKAVPGSPLAIWFNRNILLGDAAWPQDFYLDVAGLEGGEMVIPRGDDWPIECTVMEGEEVFPEELWIELPATEILMEKLTDGRSFRVLMRKVLEPTEARIVGKGGRTPWFNIRLVNRPEVVDLELVSERPDYIGGEEVLPPGEGPYYVLKGSTLKVVGTASKELSSAYLVREGSGETEARFPLELVGGMGFEGEVPANVFAPGAYTLVLLDREKVRMPGSDALTPLASRSNVQFTIRELPDRPPVVKMRLSGVSSMVVPGALVPFQVRAEDDFAVTRAKIDHQWISENAAEGVEPTSGALDLPEPEPELDEDGKAIAVDAKARNYPGALEIADLKVPVGSSLTLEGVAFDNDTVSGPNEGRSSKVLLRVVAESELRADLLRREKEDRQALEEITKLQDQTFTDTRGIQVSSRSEEGISPENRSLLLKLQKRQKLLATNVMPIIDRLTQVIEEYKNNRLVGEDGKGLERLQGGAVVHLEVIAGTLMPDAALHLETARRLGDDAEGREKAFTDAAAKQEEIIEKLRLVLRNLEKNEGFQQVLNLLHEIEGSERQLMERTEEEKKKRLEDLLKPKQSEGIDNSSESNPSNEKDKEE